MLFPTFDFAIFFGVVYLGAWLLNERAVAWKLFVLAASYYFYAYWDWRFCFLLLASTVIAHVGASAIDASGSDRARRGWLTASLVGLLGLLGWFKYYGFFAVNVDNLLHTMGAGNLAPLLTPTLPIAISFFTFMAVSYVVDVYRGTLAPATPIDLAVYLSFFPHLVAGPIVRGGELLPQLRRPRDPHAVDLSRASALIMGGLFKKIVVSSYVATAIVDPVFANPGLHSGPEVIFAVWGYAVQIYCDFSGYTDIAIGCALLLGFRFPENFNSPYTSRSLQDFWRRWHITLSFWLRDYLYIPLGGNKGSRWVMYRNIMITMLLGGLWHGAGWTYVAWGGLHGLGQCTGHFRRQRRKARGLPAQSDAPLAVAWQRFATFQYVCLGWVFFRATSFGNAFAMLDRLVSGWSLPSPDVTFPVVLTVVVGIGTQYVPEQVSARIQDVFGRLRPVLQGAALAAVLLVITTMGPPGVAPFIYFKF